MSNNPIDKNKQTKINHLARSILLPFYDLQYIEWAHDNIILPKPFQLCTSWHVIKFNV